MQLYLHDDKFLQYCKSIKLTKEKPKKKNICSIGFQVYTNAADHETDFVV